MKYDILQRFCIFHIAARLPDTELLVARQTFIDLDANNDGKLSEQELFNAIPETEKMAFKTEKVFQLLDSNKDNHIDYIGKLNYIF